MSRGGGLRITPEEAAWLKERAQEAAWLERAQSRGSIHRGDIPSSISGDEAHLPAAEARTEGRATLSFFVAGKPKSTQTGSIITVNGRSFPIRRGTAWSSVCGLVARQHAPAEPLTGPLAVTLTFYFSRPKGSKRTYPTVRPDAENLAKGLLDSWNGILYADDSQVVNLHLVKRYSLEGGVGVVVEVEELRSG